MCDLTIFSAMSVNECRWLLYSSDLWVTGDVPGTTNLSIESSVSYASGSATGYINTADLGFDDFTISSQAYSM